MVAVQGGVTPLPARKGMGLAVGSIHSGLWEPTKCPPLFSRMEMWGANELDGFRASTKYFILSESLAHVFSSSVPCISSVTQRGQADLAFRKPSVKEEMETPKQHFQIQEEGHML